MAKRTYSKKYKVGDEVVPGTTTVIKTSLGWGTQALIGWAVKITKEGGDHRKAMESAADAGTLAHALVEAYCKKALGLPVEAIDMTAYTAEQVTAANNAFDAFIMWKEGSKLTIVASEEEFVSSSLKYGGSIDLIFQDENGRRHICDVKTTNYLLPDHLIQVAAYAYGYSEANMGYPIHAGHLLRFNKGNATTFHHTQWSTEALKLGMEAFKSLRSLYDLKKQIEGVC